MQKIVLSPTHELACEAVQNASNELQRIDLRTVRGEQRDRLKAAREAVKQAQESLLRV